MIYFREIKLNNLISLKYIIKSMSLEDHQLKRLKVQV